MGIIMDKDKILSRTLLHILVAVYGVTCLWLYYRQSIADLSVTVNGVIPFQSDLPLHISMVIEDHWYYSFTAYVYQILHVLCQGSTVGIAMFLSLITVTTIYVTEDLLLLLAGKKEKNWKTLAIAITLNFVMPIFVPAVGEYRYVSYQAANIWHNSTYICMKLVALLAIQYYFILEEKYEKGLTAREWLTFAFINIICTGVKPSFLLAFSPIMGIYLLIDLLKGKSLSKILIFGSALLPSGLVIVWQRAVLFGDETGNGVTLKPWFTFSLHTAKPKLAVILSMLFCILAVAVTLYKEYKDKRYIFVLAMTALGFMEALCLVEEGNRNLDGNFLWGYSFCLFVLFVMCAAKWLRMNRTKSQSVIRVLLGIVYCLHLYCGIYYFVMLAGGSTYWLK